MPRIAVFDETGGPEVLQVVAEPMPTPGPGEVRVQVEAIGVNRLDALVRAGIAPLPIALPHARLGIEATGTIEAIGDGVDGWALGDAVIATAVPDFGTNGTYAESIVVPAQRVVTRPEGLDPTVAAALWVGHSTAYGAMVLTARVQPGDHVLITAASSSVGLAAIQIANQIGAVPIAVTRGAAKRDRLLEAGAAAVIVSESEDVAQRGHELTDGAGVDLIVDSVMGAQMAATAGAARPGGTLVAVGWLDPRPPTFPTVAPFTIHRYVGFAHILDPAVVGRMAAFIEAGARTGVIAPVIDSVFALDDVVDAHRHMEDGEQFGKIVLTV